MEKLENMTNSKNLANIGKVEELETIRGLAAILVVFHHIPKWNPILDIGIINNGYLMVELFFVLSGFVIFNSYNEKIHNSSELIRFQFLRFSRLYPVHFTFLLLFLAIEITKYIAVNKFNILSIQQKPFDKNNFTALFQQIFLLQAILPIGNSLTFNEPAWSISVEFYMYFIFSVIILFCKKEKYFIFSLLSILSITMLSIKETYGFEEFLRCLAGFSLGCLTAGTVKYVKIVLPRHSPLITSILIIIFLYFKKIGDYDYIIYFLTSALIASIILSKDGNFKKFLRNKILAYLGVISYSVYMSHLFVLLIISNVIKRVFRHPEIQGESEKLTLSLTVSETIMAIIFLLLCILFISILVYCYIEKPLREKSRRFSTKFGNHVSTKNIANSSAQKK